MLAGQKCEPSPTLLAIMNKFNPDIAGKLKEKLGSLGEKFTVRYTSPGEDGHPGSHASFAARRLMMGEKLFYRSVFAHVLLMTIL